MDSQLYNGEATISLTALLRRGGFYRIFVRNFLADDEILRWTELTGLGGVEIRDPGALSTEVVFRQAGTFRFKVKVTKGSRETESEVIVIRVANSEVLLNVDFTDTARYSPDISWEENFPFGTELSDFGGNPIPGSPAGDRIDNKDMAKVKIKRAPLSNQGTHQYLGIPDLTQLIRLGFRHNSGLIYPARQGKKFEMRVEFVCEDSVSNETTFVFTDTQLMTPGFDVSPNNGNLSAWNPKWAWGFFKIRLHNGRIDGRIIQGLEHTAQGESVPTERYTALGSFSPYESITLKVTLQYNVNSAGNLIGERMWAAHTNGTIIDFGSRGNNLGVGKGLSLNIYRNPGGMTAVIPRGDIRLLNATFRLVD